MQLLKTACKIFKTKRKKKTLNGTITLTRRNPLFGKRNEILKGKFQVNKAELSICHKGGA